MTFSVVILSARASNLVPCVRALLKHEPGLAPEQIVVVDDGARAEAEPQLPPVRWVAGARPFVYARNANLGIQAAGTDVVLLNDDALLATPQGFADLSRQVERRAGLGICSAAVRGVVGNPRQHPTRAGQIRVEPQTLAFVCVYIPRAVYERIGPLDERFVGYGYEDNDYCGRVRAAGLELGIWDGCVVEHESLPSTFRTRPDIDSLFRQNQRLFEQKRYEPSVESDRQVDLLYLAYNRLEFTQETFTTLLANTDWHYVRELFVYDDGSRDGTREWLERAIVDVEAPVRFVKTEFSSPVAAMVHFIDTARAPILAKVDNDAMMPPGWLGQCLAVLRRHPELDLLGIEAFNPHQDDPHIARSYTPVEFISGLGLYRRAAFAHSRPAPYQKYYGLEEWQVAQGPRLTRGWITPALPVFLLDRFPLEPWAGYSDTYIKRGWQRSWPRYDPDCTLWCWRWPAAAGERLRLNLGCFDMPLAGWANASLLHIPGAEPVDLRQPWPWADSSVDHIRACDLLEHLPDKIFTMNELWRVLRDGGTAEIIVPTTDGTGAFQDPAHVSFWNRRSFLYYEAGNPYRERFAQRYGITARFRVVHEQIEATDDGPRLTIRLRAIKSAGAAAEDLRFLGALRIKNEAHHIHDVIARILPLCQRVFIFDDHSTDDTIAICRSLGERVTVFPSPFEGLDEVRDKNYLLEKIIAADPEWVLWIDGDEVLEHSGPEKLKAACSSQGIAAFTLKIAYVWNDPHHIRVDGIYGRFTRASLFRLRGQPVDQLHFLASGYGGNFHCGNVPRGLVGITRPINVRLKHFGYMTSEQRQAKYAWYNAIDPNNDLEDRYRHIAEIPGARYAPGPPRVIPWRE